MKMSEPLTDRCRRVSNLGHLDVWFSDFVENTLATCADDGSFLVNCGLNLLVGPLHQNQPSGSTGRNALNLDRCGNDRC